MGERTENRKIGFMGTVIFHGLILLLFILLGYSTPLPLPDEEGILINFGTEETGSGAKDTRDAEERQNTPQPLTETTVQDKQILTQDYEEAPVIKQTAEKPKQPVKQPEKPLVAEKKPEPAPVETPKPEVKKVNPTALYPGRTAGSTSTSEGATYGPGNQGSPTGSPDSDNRTQGSSAGTSGISYNLSGRNPQSLPSPEYKVQESGVVVVEVTVDNNGNVTQAIPGVRGSTTLNETLLKSAQKAALIAKFDRKPDAPAFQKGTITYRFVLQ